MTVSRMTTVTSSNGKKSAELLQGDGVSSPLWHTARYELWPSEEGAGYKIINTGTQTIEAFADQEPAAVISLLWMEDNWQDIMDDPVREFKRRKAMQSSRSAPQQASGLVRPN